MIGWWWRWLVSNGYSEEALAAGKEVRKEARSDFLGAISTGATAGGSAGGLIGGGIGALAGGVGAPPGSAIGAAIGFVGGAIAGGAAYLAANESPLGAGMTATEEYRQGETAEEAAEKGLKLAAAQEKKLLTAAQKKDTKAASKTVSSDRVLAANTTTPAGPQTTGFGQESVHTPAFLSA